MALDGLERISEQRGRTSHILEIAQNPSLAPETLDSPRQYRDSIETVGGGATLTTFAERERRHSLEHFWVYEWLHFLYAWNGLEVTQTERVGWGLEACRSLGTPFGWASQPAWCKSGTEISGWCMWWIIYRYILSYCIILWYHMIHVTWFQNENTDDLTLWFIYDLSSGKWR